LTKSPVNSLAAKELRDWKRRLTGVVDFLRGSAMIDERRRAARTENEVSKTEQQELNTEY